MGLFSELGVLTDFDWQPKQLELVRSSAPLRLAVGGVRSGKTTGALMYGLYYSSQTVSNYMRAYHLTPSQVEQEVQAQP